MNPSDEPKYIYTVPVDKHPPYRIGNAPPLPLSVESIRRLNVARRRFFRGPLREVKLTPYALSLLK